MENKIFDYLNRCIAKINKILLFNSTCSSREQACYYNIMFYQSLLCDISNIGESLKNQHYKSKEKFDNLTEIIPIYAKLISVPEQRIHWTESLLSKFFSFIQGNPFFLGNLHFIGIKHESAYFSTKEKGNYGFRCFKLFFEIASRCIFNDERQAKEFFNKIKLLNNGSDDDLYTKCQFIYGQYGDKLDQFLGLVYDSKFMDLLSYNDMDALNKMLNFFSYLKTKDDSGLEINKYNLGEKFTNNE